MGNFKERLAEWWTCGICFVHCGWCPSVPRGPRERFSRKTAHRRGTCL